VDRLYGYHEFISKEGNTRNSGCGLFIKDNLTYKVRNDLSLSHK